MCHVSWSACNSWVLSSFAGSVGKNCLNTPNHRCWPKGKVSPRFLSCHRNTNLMPSHVAPYDAPVSMLWDRPQSKPFKEWFPRTAGWKKVAKSKPCIWSYTRTLVGTKNCNSAKHSCVSIFKHRWSEPHQPVLATGFSHCAKSQWVAQLRIRGLHIRLPVGWAMHAAKVGQGE